MKLQSEAHIPQKEAGGDNPKTSIARRLLSRCGWADPAIRKRVINDRHQAGGGIAQRGVSSLTSTHLELRSNHYQFSWQYYHPSVKGQYSLDRSHHSFVWEAPLSRSLWEGFSSHFTEEVLQISLFQNQFFFASGKGNRPDVLAILANLLLGKMKCFSVPILNCVVGSCRFRITAHNPESQRAVASVDGFCTEIGFVEIGADFIWFCREPVAYCFSDLPRHDESLRSWQLKEQFAGGADRKKTTMKGQSGEEGWQEKESKRTKWWVGIRWHAPACCVGNTVWHSDTGHPCSASLRPASCSCSCYVRQLIHEAPVWGRSA